MSNLYIITKVHYLKPLKDYIIYKLYWGPREDFKNKISWVNEYEYYNLEHVNCKFGFEVVR